MDVRVGLQRKLCAKEMRLLNCGVGEDSLASLGLQGDPTSPSWRKSVLNIHWKLKLQYFGHLMWRTDWLEKTLMLGKIEGIRRRGPQRMWWLDGITDSTDMSWASSGSWRWTGRPGVLQSMGSQRVKHDWATELNWTDKISVDFSVEIVTKIGALSVFLVLHHEIVNSSFLLMN